LEDKFLISDMVLSHGSYIPLLFNLVGDVLNKILAKASAKNLVKGLLGHFRPGGIMTLQYADDTLLFSTYDSGFIRNFKLVLNLFERVSGMRINFHKSEFIPINLGEEVCHEIAHILACPMGSLPFKYLGVPLYFERLKREDLQPILDKMVKKAAGWRGRLLAYSSRLVLIQSCLASVHGYLVSFMKFPKWTIKLLESQMAHCLWNNSEEGHKYHLAT
jgi:hypothetical protein